ncbi:MAG: DsbA family oxidoreductase [Chloroflexota bacterium]
MKVEIFSDVVCPWCYIGKRRFERALEAFDGASDVEVEWRSFQLNPDQPRGAVGNHDDHLARKMGVSVERVREINEQVTGLAAAEGLDYHFETYKVVNTFDVHRLLHFAKANGVGEEAEERLLRAQLVEGATLDDIDTLVGLAGELGLDTDAARAALESDAYADAVTADLELARAFGISGVPFFVIDRKYGISGAQPPEAFLQVFEKIRDEAAAAV